MNPISLKSSIIASVAYDERKNELQIKFVHGSEHVYKEISFDVFNALVKASSPGKYYLKNIRGKYEYEKVGL